MDTVRTATDVAPDPNRRPALVVRLLALSVLAVSLAGPSVRPCQARDARRPDSGDYLASGATLDYQRRTSDIELDRIGIRFRSETQARVRNGELVSLAGADLSEVRDLVAALPGARLERRFPRSEAALDHDRELGEARKHARLPDLNLFALLVLPPTDTRETGVRRLEDVLSRLNAAGPVAEAWALPLPQPAGFRQISLAPPRLPAPIIPETQTEAETQAQALTPDFSPLQGYLYDPPVGLAADAAWAFAGGKGEGVRMIDLEFGWLFTHEDLKPPWYYGGPPAVSDHGTAVMGEFGGQHNGFGVSGIAPEMEIGGINTSDLAASIAEATGVLSPGDLYLIEIQVSGPEGWMPMEWIPDVFAAIQTSTALGIICVEAGANGSVNLDDDQYGGLFDRRVRDSGAILVGAGTPEGVDAEWFSDYGSRLDLQGWGSAIVTTGYGDLQDGPAEEQYTAGFSGTSGASPMVVGSVASLQGQALALFGDPLTPRLAEEILSVTGTPWNGTRQIGERPNLAAARDRLLLGYGDVLLTVRDGDSGEPLPDMVVEIVESGRLAKTGPDGQVALQMTAETQTFRVEGTFLYAGTEVPCTVQQGEQQELTIDVLRFPTGAIAGTVRDAGGSGLAGVRVSVAGTPLDSTWTDATGYFHVGGVPENTGYQVYASQLPGYGAAQGEVAVTANRSTIWNPVLVDAETFEAGPAGYTATGEFELGSTPSQFPPEFSGVNVWGTNLDGYYQDSTTSTLTSPVFDLGGAGTLTLSFHHYYWIEEHDGGQVQVWDAGQNDWVVVEPVGGYPDPFVPALLYTPGYNGNRFDGWEPAVFRLSQYAGGSFRFRFNFRTDASGRTVGWYIDDIALDTGQGDVVSVDPGSLIPGGASGLRVVSTGPNPFRGATRVVYEIRKPGPVRFEIFAPSGLRVRALALGPSEPGRHALRWDGRDDAGHPLESGVYFYKLSAGTDQATGRLVSIR